MQQIGVSLMYQIDTEDTINNPAFLLQRIYPKEIKRQIYSSIQDIMSNQEGKNGHKQTFHL